VRRSAHVVHEVLDELGAVGFPKTSGGNGMHVYVRIRPEHGFADVRRAALAFAREVERRLPDDVTTTWWRKDRAPRGVRRLQPERPRPHDRGGLLGARDARGSRVGPLRGTRSTGDFRSRLGARDIDDHVFDITPLLEWADRDEAAGDEEPPDDPTVSERGPRSGG
jgi:hypothetical protein